MKKTGTIKKTAILLALVAATSNVYADRWFGCGKVTKLNHYGKNQIRFDISGIDYASLGICQYPNAAHYGRHYLEKTEENSWVFSMYLAAYMSGKSVRLYAPDNTDGPCKVENVPIYFCD